MITSYKKIAISLLTAISISILSFGQNIESTYRNPVIMGDFPDPTVIRVENNYYAAGTSGDYVPLYPIYHSTDLVNWNKIGAVFDRPPSWVMGDCWAPELFYENGTYFVYYTARQKENGISCIGVATTTDITKGFNDQGVMIEWGKEAIDAFVFKDEDGKCYITWKAYGLNNDRPIEILCSELSADRLSLIGEPFTLTDKKNGWLGHGEEGQCLVKHDGYYYLIYSIGGCCDRNCDYRVHVARSKNLKGGWEQYEHNPILQGEGLWKCTGHGTLTQTPDHRFFYLYHAYHAYDLTFVGRQGLLDEILWDEKSGWPYFRYGNKPSLQADAPLKNTVQKPNYWFYDDFKSDRNDQSWIWDMTQSEPMISKDNGILTVTVPHKQFSFRGMSPQTGNYVMETSVANDEVKNFRGLSVYGNNRNMLIWGIENKELKLYSVENSVKTLIYSQSIPVEKAYLRIESINAVAFRFAWSENREDWNYYPKSNEAISANFLPQWGKGVRVGIIVDASTMHKGNNNNVGRFYYFSINSK